MNASATAAALLLGVLCATACASSAPGELAGATSEHLDQDRPELALFQTVRGRIDADEAVSYTFHGESGWTVDVLAATPDQTVSFRAPHVVVVDETTGATVLDLAESLAVQGRSGHTLRLPSSGPYTVTLSPLFIGVSDEAFTLELEALIPCGGTAGECPAALSCQGASPDGTPGQCWPAELGPQRCDASGHGDGCVPPAHSECDSSPRATCQANTFVCARTGGTESAKSCLGSATRAVCCQK